LLFILKKQPDGYKESSEMSRPSLGAIQLLIQLVTGYCFEDEVTGRVSVSTHPHSA